MDTKYVRTTITIPEDLLFDIKKKAAEEKKSFKLTVEEGLKIHVGSRISASSQKDLISYFGAWGKGISGQAFLKKVRYSAKETNRQKYLDQIIKNISA